MSDEGIAGNESEAVALLLSDFNQIDIFENVKLKLNRASTVTLDTTITHFTDQQRAAFFGVFITIFAIAFFGNIASLVVTFKRKMRIMQKTLNISLGISDLIFAVFVSITNICMFSNRWTVWVLGEAMCSAVPFLQNTAIIANSLSLTSIAIYRYCSIVRALQKKWDPDLKICLIHVFVIWIISAGTSYPMLTGYMVIPVYVITMNNGSVQSINEINMCITKEWKGFSVYYTVLFCIIFTPVLCTVLWSYYKIAKLLWERRKPLTNQGYKTNVSVTVETSMGTNVKSLEDVNTTVSVISKGERQVKKELIKNRTIQTERKLKIFKIIIALMVVFLVCRFPMWVLNIVRLSTTLNDPEDWVWTYALSALSLSNSAINPFLYSFLYETIAFVSRFFKSLSDFFCRICFCCCSNTEFEEFEKENPFMVNNYGQRKSQASDILPRGPYMETQEPKRESLTFGNSPIYGQSNEGLY